jgi:hypothetical protein
MSTYDANPQELARRTEVLHSVAKGVEAVFQEHQDRVERIGDIWGTDDMGEQFARRYVPNSKDFDDYAHHLSQGVRSSIDAVVDTARRIHITEQENTEHSRARP